MRKHDVRKWLHAVLDLLPVILIPVFMIYSHRHDVAQDFEVTTQEPIYYQSNEVNSFDDLIIGNIYTWNDNYSLTNPNQTIILLTLGNVEELITEYGFTYNEEGICNIVVNWSGCYLTYSYTNYNQISNINSKYFQLVLANINNTTFDTSLYTHLIETERLLVKEYLPVVTNIPKDVMTSFIARFNNTINEYFNMGNVFNLNGVYEWFNINIFSGNAPTVIYSIWNIALYELVMDLLFLLYGLFMWFIDMVEHLMEKPFKSIK